MPSIYNNAVLSLNFVRTLTSIEGRDAILQQKLTTSAGKLKESRTIEGESLPAGATIYRFYYVAAKALQQNRSDQTITEADRAKFTNLAVMIQSFFEEQLAMDRMLDLEIPPGFAGTKSLTTMPIMSILVGP